MGLSISSFDLRLCRVAAGRVAYRNWSAWLHAVHNEDVSALIDRANTYASCFHPVSIINKSVDSSQCICHPEAHHEFASVW